MTSFLVALRFLTILPVGKAVTVDAALFVRSSRFYPLAGLILGGMGWVFFRLTRHVFPEDLAAGLLLGFGVLMTGALHLDGLADTLDGLYGGRTPAERLAIMKDVHPGAMGVVGLVVLLGIKYLALKLLVSSPASLYWLILLPVAGRWTPVVLAGFWPYARAEGGLGRGLVRGVGKKELFWATLFAWGIVVGTAGWAGFGLMGVHLMWCLIAGWYFSRKLGGVTGDTLGAVIETGELAGILFVLGIQA